MNKVFVADIGGTNIKSAVVSSNGIISKFLSSQTPKEYGKIISYITQSADDTGETFDTVAVAIPGVYDKKSGKVLFAPNIPNMANKELKNDLEAALGNKFKVIIENDANMAALGEHQFGFEVIPDSMVMVTLGTGVGGGIIYNNNLLSSDITITELGHITILAEGRQCECGKKGCFEKYCSVSAIIADYREITGKSAITTREVAQLYAENDRTAIQIMDNFSLYLAHGLSSIINLITPKYICIGGGLSEIAHCYLPKTQDLLKTMVYPAFRNHTNIKTAKYRNDAALLGGVVLADTARGY